MQKNRKVTVVIPNYNGIKYMEECLKSLYANNTDFETIVIDNGSTDGSRELVENNYPQVRLMKFSENQGFCKAVNVGIEAAETPFILLLNNDTMSAPGFVENMVEAIEKSEKIFSVSSKMLSMSQPEYIDDCGDLYCGLGWAFSLGKGKMASEYYNREANVFAACGGASIYRKSVFNEIGLFDDNHFAYLEDIDIGYRSKIYGYKNMFCPKAVVYHAGSGFSGSRYNEFKIRLSARNSIYLIYKNMPLLQILINSPLLIIGIFIKWLFFFKKGFGALYIKNIIIGLKFCTTQEARKHKVYIKKEKCINYVTIQIELWWNILRKIFG